MPPSEQEIIGRLRAAQAKDLLRRGLRVQARARELIGGAGPGHPKRVDTGDTRSSIQVQLRSPPPASPVVRVGSNRLKSRWIHDGTGLYGPRHQKITPKHGKALVFRSKTHGQKSGKFAGKVVVRSVKGMKPNPFLRAALRAARD